MNGIDKMFKDDGSIHLIEEFETYGITDELEKARKKPVGSKSPDGKYIKTGEGKWVPVKKERQSKDVDPFSLGSPEALTYTAPDKFKASSWALQWDSNIVTPDLVLQYVKSDEVKAKIKATEAKLTTVTQTIENYRKSGEGASAVYGDDRQAIHNKIITKILSPENIHRATPEKGEAPVLIMLGGRGGSGKSSLKGLVYEPEKCITLDADEVKQMLPEYEGWNAFEVHEESSDIIKKMTVIAQTMGLNVVVDATLKTTKSAIKQVTSFKEKGYRLECHYMHLPRAKASVRAVSRFAGATGRYVPIDVILSNTTNEATFEAIRPMMDAWTFHDNSFDPPPKLISKKGDGRYSHLSKAMVFGDVLMKSKFKIRKNADAYDFYDFGDVTDPKDYSADVKELIKKLSPLKKARGYKLAGVRNFQGLQISVEHNKGGVRTGVDKDGHKWKTKMHYAYGGIRRTRGVDGDYVDCYIGDNADSEKVYIIHQNDPTTGKYDEDKVMLGFTSRKNAEKAYLKQYDRPGFLGSIVETDMTRFKLMLKDSYGVKLKKSMIDDGIIHYGRDILSASEMLQKGYKGTRGVPDGSGYAPGQGCDSEGQGAGKPRQRRNQLADSMKRQGEYKEGDDILIPAGALKQGIDVEMEHTDDPDVAKQIALDHIAENPNYYDYLKEMEEGMEAQKSIKHVQVLNKAKKMPIGTISHGRKKVAENKWVPVKSGKSSKYSTDAEVKKDLANFQKKHKEDGYSISMRQHEVDNIDSGTTARIMTITKQGAGDDWKKIETFAGYLHLGKDKNKKLSKDEWSKYKVGQNDSTAVATVAEKKKAVDTTLQGAVDSVKADIKKMGFTTEKSEINASDNTLKVKFVDKAGQRVIFKTNFAGSDKYDTTFEVYADQVGGMEFDPNDTGTKTKILEHIKNGLRG